MHAKQVMRKIRRLSRPFPLETAQERLDAIAELATSPVDCDSHAGVPCTGRLSLNREEGESLKSAYERAKAEKASEASEAEAAEPAELESSEAPDLFDGDAG